MLGYRIREILFGNWRNKGVALFFAVIIWMVAYQAEQQSGTIQLRLVPIASNPEEVIIGQEVIGSKGTQASFDGTVTLSVNGSRKQIENLSGGGRLRDVPYEVEADDPQQLGPKNCTLKDEDFSEVIPQGVEITSISPPSIVLTFDRAEVKEFKVEAHLTPYPAGMIITDTEITPPTVRLRGPATVLGHVGVQAEAWLGSETSFVGMVPLVLRYPETLEEKVQRTVTFMDHYQVQLRVNLQPENDSFEDSVRLRFLVPAAEFPMQIQFPEEMIQVKFQGPVGEIQRLKNEVKDPKFFLAVPVRLPLPDKGQDLTSSETDLLLYGYSKRVQILQHSARKAKVSWAYTVVPKKGAPK